MITLFFTYTETIVVAAGRNDLYELCNIFDLGKIAGFVVLLFLCNILSAFLVLVREFMISLFCYLHQ